MSAFIVDTSHIDAMIRVALNVSQREFHFASVGPYGVLTHETADDIGQMLMNENTASVNFRYSEDDLAEPYTYAPFGKMPTAIEGVKLVQCYEYQSCEHADWETSKAKRFCEVLISYLISNLPGYDDAPWGWQETRKTNVVRLI